MSNILEFFPKDRTPRPVQIDTLLQVEKAWDASDCIVINLPVASGKSLIAVTIARWVANKGQGTRILTPTNVLVEQYMKDFPRLHTVRKKASYICEEETPLSAELNCKDACAQRGRPCDGCPYIRARNAGSKASIGVYNYYTYKAHKYHNKECIIFDEAHNLIPTIKDMEAKHLWHHNYGFPPAIKTYGALLTWVERHPNLKTDRKLLTLYEELVSGRTSFLVQKGTDLYMGQERECLKLLPVDIRNAKPHMWPGRKIKKLVLLSATIGFKDIESLGLDKRKVTFIHADSPIPPERRPVHYNPVGSLSMANQELSVPLLAARIKELLKSHPEKGFIHITYSLAFKLKPFLIGENRLLWHDRENKMEKYQEFRNSPPEKGAVMVASGLYEGVDLPEDMGRWQVITKVPWPSLGEPAVQYLAEADPEWYANETVKTVLQASGRICRSTTDFGETFLVDSSFKRLYDEWTELFPDWYRKGIIWPA